MAEKPEDSRNYLRQREPRNRKQLRHTASVSSERNGYHMKRKKIRKILASPAVTLSAFVLAAGLLLFSSIGGARAALTYYSDTYASSVELSEIGIQLLENGTVAAGDLLLPEVEEEVKLGKTYREELAVRNSGDINQYVRATVYKYWLVPEEGSLPGDGTEGEDAGNWVKSQELGPDLIELHLTEGSGWVVDSAASTPERTMLYYGRVLKSGEDGAGETTPLFADTLTIAGRTAQIVKQETVDGAVKTTYAYDGARFCIEVRVDAVQEHNAEAAIWSAWGRKVTINDGNLTLN